MSWVAKAELVALGAGITPFSCTSLGLQGLQVYRLHRGESPNHRLRCLQWLNRQPQWPQWGWNQVSCPCSWQQGLWDLRFQPISIGNTSFLSFGAHPLSPISPPTNPLVIPDQGPSPSLPSASLPPPQALGLSMSALVTGWWGLGSRQLCRVSSWRGGVCCSYGPWGELLQGWTVSTPWQFGTCVPQRSYPHLLWSSLLFSVRDQAWAPSQAVGPRERSLLSPFPPSSFPSLAIDFLIL